MVVTIQVQLIPIFLVLSPQVLASVYEFPLGQATIVVNIQGKANNLQHDDLLQWVKNSARTVVEHYYRRFSSDHLRVDINISADKDVHSGKAFGHSGPLVRVGIGRDSTSFHLKERLGDGA